MPLRRTYKVTLETRLAKAVGVYRAVEFTVRASTALNAVHQAIEDAHDRDLETRNPIRIHRVLWGCRLDVPYIDITRAKGREPGIREDLLDAELESSRALPVKELKSFRGTITEEEEEEARRWLKVEAGRARRARRRLRASKAGGGS